MPGSLLPKEIIARLTGYFAAADDSFRADSALADLSMKQVYYIEILGRLGRPTFGDLAKALSLSKPSVTAIVERLSAAGYARKEQSRDDRRSFHISLTERGRRVCAMHDEFHERIVAGLSRHISDAEAAQLMMILSKIAQGIANDGTGKAPGALA